MDATSVAVLALATALVALVVTLVVIALGRGKGAAGDGRVQEQLAEVRSRVDALAEAQRDVPRAVAEGSAIQARSLAGVRERLAEVLEATRRLEAVGNAVEELQQVFRVPKLRGPTGELLLEELLGDVLPGAAYEMEHQFRSGERVDAVVRVRDRLVPIDAKFPLEAYARMLRLDGAAAERERRAFRRTLMARVDEIAGKYIRPEEGTYEFAVMYVPAESIYHEAVLGGDDSVARYALAHKVMLASPNTLYAYLSAVAHGLRGLEVERHAAQILEGLGALGQDVGKLEDALDLLSRHLSNAVKQLDEAGRRGRNIADRIGGLTAGESSSER